MKSSPRQDMFAQVAINNGDAINAYKLMNNNLSFPDCMEILAGSPNYKKILPAALGVYTKDGHRFGEAIAKFSEFDHRRRVAKELTTLIEKKEHDPIEAVSGLEDPHVLEQLYDIDKKIKSSFNLGNDKAVYLTIMSAMYGKSKTIDHMLNKACDDSIVYPLYLAIKNYNKDTFNGLADQVFGLYSELEKKQDIDILNPAMESNNVKLAKALRSFANRYQKEIKQNDQWCYSTPKFNADSYLYSWEDNSFEKTVKRVEKLFEIGRPAFVRHVLERISGDETRMRFRDEKFRESPQDVLKAAEKIKKAKLPKEIYIALGTEWEGLKLTEFAKNIFQKRVLAQIRKLDKMGNSLAKAAIGYTACHETPKDVRYVADNILKVTQFKKAKRIFRWVMRSGRSGKGAERLNYFLPEGINIRHLPMDVRELIKRVGFEDLECKKIVHKLLRENLDIVKKTSKDLLKKPLYIYGFNKPEETEKKLKEWLGLEVKKQKDQSETLYIDDL